MLTLLRAEDFRRTLKTAPVNLVELIQKVIDQVRPFLEARHSELVTELDDDLGPFELDADKISAVLINLITNAIKFTPDGGTIELVARRGAGPERRDPGAGPRRRASTPRPEARVSAVFHPA